MGPHPPVSEAHHAAAVQRTQEYATHLALLEEVVDAVCRSRIEEQGRAESTDQEMKRQRWELTA